VSDEFGVALSLTSHSLTHSLTHSKLTVTHSEEIQKNNNAAADAFGPSIHPSMLLTMCRVVVVDASLLLLLLLL